MTLYGNIGSLSDVAEWVGWLHSSHYCDITVFSVCIDFWDNCCRQNSAAVTFDLFAHSSHLTAIITVIYVLW